MADHQDYIDMICDRDKRIKELEAERDKWQSKAHHLNCEMIGTKRLREALERIAEETGGMTSPSFIEDIARKALEDE